MRTNSALSYFGSDSEVAERLSKPLDSVSHVTIPFVGGGSIIPYLKAKAIVCNDLNSEVYTFYQCAKGSIGSDQQAQKSINDYWVCRLSLQRNCLLPDGRETAKDREGNCRVGVCCIA